MRFAIYSVEGTSLSWWKRLQDEGHDVLVYVQKREDREIGLGIVPRSNNLTEWAAWGRGGIYFFDCTDAGKIASNLQRAGEIVVGGGLFCDKLEKDRSWGEAIARQAGMAIPKSHQFSSVSQAQAWLSKRKPEEKFYFKPDKNIGTNATTGGNVDKLIRSLQTIKETNGDNLENLLQEHIEGVGISTARWWNGKDFVGPFEGTIENKAFMNDGLGPATGCSLNTVWFYESNLPSIAAALCWQNLGDLFRRYNAPPGLYDINAQVSEKTGDAFFLEWTPRLGADSEMTSQRGIADLGKLLYTLGAGGDPSDLFTPYTYFSSVRLSVPPYPFEDVDGIPEKKSPYGWKVHGADGLWSGNFVGYSLKWDENSGLVLADKTGLVGIAIASDQTVEGGFKKVYRYLESKQLEVRALQYRTDAAKIVLGDMEKLEKTGYEVL